MPCGDAKLIVGPLRHLRLRRLFREVAGTYSLQAVSAAASKLRDAKETKFRLSPGSHMFARKSGLEQGAGLISWISAPL